MPLLIDTITLNEGSNGQVKANVNNLFAVQNLKMALKKANILQHTKSFFV